MFIVIIATIISSVIIIVIIIVIVIVDPPGLRVALLRHVLGGGRSPWHGQMRAEVH